MNSTTSLLKVYFYEMKKTGRYLLWLLTFLILLSCSGLAILKIDQHGYLYVSFSWLVIIAIFVWQISSEKKRLIAIYAGSVLLAFFWGELYFSKPIEPRISQLKHEYEVIYGKGHYNPDDLLGYALAPDSKWVAKTSYRDSVIFDVIQTTDSQGLRLTPGKVIEGAEQVLFLGCSFTFGAGLNDYETLPYYLQSESSESLRSVNMAHMGYGAHQVLAILQEGLEKKAFSIKKPKAGIYSAITDYVFRGTGRLGESIGPKYVLNAYGKLEKRDNVSSFKIKLLRELSKSYIFKHFFNQRAPSKESEVDLVVAMIGESAKIFTDRYNAPFYCILWDEMFAEEGLYEKLLQKLQNLDIEVFEVKEILSDYDEHPENYAFAYDGHPNSFANQLIAEYLWKNVLSREVAGNIR